MKMSELLFHKKFHLITLVVLAGMLYFNTLNNGFVLDDFLVIKNNEFTTKGIQGIPDLLRYDSFRGFLKSEQSGSAVTGGRYRPLTLVWFALIYEMAGAQPWIFHLLNILFFMALCVSIYFFVNRLLLSSWPDSSRPISFLTALLFTAHPVHTEVVANIKGLDEIWSLLFSILAFHAILLRIDTGLKKYWIWSGVFFLLAVFSKENASHFLLLAPLGIMMFRGQKILDAILNVVPMLSSFLVYMAARITVIGFTIFEKPTKDLMTNPFLKYRGKDLVDADFSERLGMIFYALVKYIGLLIFPHPLTHDYFPKHIPLQKLASPVPFLSLLVYGLIVFCIYRFWKSKPVVSYALLFYLIPAILISNLIFKIGTPMGERFIFTSSLGFCMLLGMLLTEFWKKRNWSPVWSALIVGILVLYGVKVFTRNMDWKDNYTLFSNDVKISRNSAKAHSSLGFDRMSKFREIRDTAKASLILSEGILHLEKAAAINPREISCYHYLGNAYYMKAQYLKSSEFFEKYLEYDPNNYDVIKNLAVSYRELGRTMALKQTDLEQALDYLFKSLKLNTKDPKTLESIGIAYGAQEKYEESLNFLHKAADMSPRDAYIVVNLANTYYKKGDRMTATELMKKAYQIDPNLGEKLSQTQKEFF